MQWGTETQLMILLPAMALVGAFLGLFISLLARGRSNQISRDILFGTVSTPLGALVLFPFDIYFKPLILYALVCALIGYLIIRLFLYLSHRPS